MSKSQVPNKEISGQIEKSELLERLKAWAGFLSEIDQEEDKGELNQICASLVSPDLLEYQDADVRLFVACCSADVLRIYAPEAPYADEQLKEIFMMFVEQLRGLEDVEGKSFKRYFYLLENLACVKTFILCMELDAPDIILSLFRTFFQIFNDRHVGKVQTFMVDIMITVMQEGDTIPQDVMDIILMHIIQPYKSRKPAAHRLACELINKSATYMEPNIQKFFNAALMKGIETDSGLHSRVYDLIKELNRVCPNILLAVLPQLQEKLKSSDVNERLEVTRLLAEMFSDKGSELAVQNKHLWKCFLGRFNDIEAAVRAECISTCKNFILNHLKLSDDCYANLYKRHRDPDEKVRLEAVKVVYAIASEDMTRMTPELYMILQERMLDKKWPIRHQAIMNVARLYKEINSKKDPTKIKQVAWMPNKVLHTYYQNTSQDRLLVERLLLSCLVPVSLGAKDRMNILLRTYCLLDLAAIKALNELLKYQQTIRMHLAALLKAIEQGIGEEDRKKLLNQVSMLSKSLPDSKTANSDLKRLSNTLVHDRSLLKAFQTIVTPGVSCQQVARAVSEIMKKLTTKNPIMDTIRALMDRTAPVLADATCITVLVNLVSHLLTCEVEADSDDEDKFNIFINGQKGLHLILSLAKVYPGQFKSQEVFEQLLVNLKNSNDEVVLMDLKILSKTAQGLDRRHPSVSSCLQPQLMKIVKDGTPKQAKQAINVINTVYKDSSKVLEHLLESMVEMLDMQLPNLASVIKAIGQIAKVSPVIFENYSREIVRDFIVTEVLTQDNESQEEGLVEDDYWCEDDELSKDARVKVESLHVMVNWVARTSGDKTVISSPVLKLLWALLQQKGDMNGSAELRLCSMSHLRLHAGLCVLKLAAEPSCFDLIPLELFQEVAWLIQDPCPEVKQAMLTKLQKGLTSMKLPLEYVALLAFYATDVGKERRSKARQILLRVIQLRRDYMIMNSNNSERNHTVLPEYAVPTLIHLLAYHPNMDIDNNDSLKSSLDVLWWFLEPLMQKNDNFPFLKKLVETVKQAVDAIDPFNDTLNERMYAICDLAFGVINCKCSNVKLPPFPGEVKLSKKFFAPPERLVPNTKSYIPEKYDFNPHRVPVAVEMEIDHPTVKKRLVVAADTPLKKKSKKKFVRKKRKTSQSDEEIAADEDEAEKATDWLNDLTVEKEDNEPDKEETIAEEEDEAPEDYVSMDDPANSSSEDEHEPEESVAEPAEPEVSTTKPKRERKKPAKLQDKPVKEKPVKEKPVKEKPVKEKPVKEKPVNEKPKTKAETKKPVETKKAKPKKKELEKKAAPPLKATKHKVVLKKQNVKKDVLFPEPEDMPAPKPSREDKIPQTVLKIKTTHKKQSKETIKKSFNSMYDQLIKNWYSPMPYHKKKSPSPERTVALPEKRLTLISTRRQKLMGMDKVDIGASPVGIVSSTPTRERSRGKEKAKKKDIRSYLESKTPEIPVGDAGKRKRARKAEPKPTLKDIVPEREHVVETMDDVQSTSHATSQEEATSSPDLPAVVEMDTQDVIPITVDTPIENSAESQVEAESEKESSQVVSEEVTKEHEMGEKYMETNNENDEDDLPSFDMDVAPTQQTTTSSQNEDNQIDSQEDIFTQINEDRASQEESYSDKDVADQEDVDEKESIDDIIEEPVVDENEDVSQAEADDIQDEDISQEDPRSSILEAWEMSQDEDEIPETEEEECDEDEEIPLLPVGDEDDSDSDDDEEEENFVEKTSKVQTQKKQDSLKVKPKLTLKKRPINNGASAVTTPKATKSSTKKPKDSKEPTTKSSTKKPKETKEPNAAKAPKTVKASKVPKEVKQPKISKTPKAPLVSKDVVVKSNMKISARNPNKPTPQALAAAVIIQEDKEMQPEIIEEMMEMRDIDTADKIPAKPARVIESNISTKDETEERPVSSEKENKKNPPTRAPVLPKPQIPDHKKRTIEPATMEDSEQEIKIKRRKTLRRSNT